MHYFGNKCDGRIILSKCGQIAKKYWEQIPEHFPNVNIDAYVIMPDHVHGILVVKKYRSNEKRQLADGRCDGVLMVNGHCSNEKRQLADGRCRDVAMRRPYGNGCVNQHMSSITPKPGSLPTVINSYKSICTKIIRQTIDKHFEWQQRYYDRIIRDERELMNTRRYIINNPKKWSAR